MATIAGGSVVLNSSSVASSLGTSSAPRSAVALPSLPIRPHQKLQSSFIGSNLPQSSSIQLLNSTRSQPIRRQNGSRLPAVRARTAGASKTYETEVDKPLGLGLGPKSGGGVVVTAVNGGGNAAKAGIKVGDQVLYTSSFFGDELWPADNVGFTRTAINAKPESVYFVLARGASDVDVKRLPKRPAPPRFGRKLTEAQKARATHVCLDCGYIYTLTKTFEDQPENFQCPQCQAPKKRFAQYDAETGRTIGGGTPIPVLLGVIIGAAAVGALAFYGLQ
ncbi:unnamed protein product [Calypogeia fissa]